MAGLAGASRQKRSGVVHRVGRGALMRDARKHRCDTSSPRWLFFSVSIDTDAGRGGELPFLEPNPGAFV